MSDECAKGCNGSDALGHAGWCWQQKYNALTEQLTAERAARQAAEQGLAETIEDRALSFRQADVAHERYLGTRRERADLQRQLAERDQQIAALREAGPLCACTHPKDEHTDLVFGCENQSEDGWFCACRSFTPAQEGKAT